MKDFPIEKIKFIKAMFNGVDGDVSIEIKISPFELSVDGYSENVDTCIRLDSVVLPVDLNELENKVFTFSVNPSPGYIDGSIYFFSAHNPIDVTSIEFGEIVSGKLPITLETTWALEYELSEFKNFDKTIVTHIEL